MNSKLPCNNLYGKNTLRTNYKTTVFYFHLLQIMADFRYDSCIRGFHIYKDIWNPVIGETLNTRREIHNLVDKYAVLSVKYGTMCLKKNQQNSGFLY